MVERSRRGSLIFCRLYKDYCSSQPLVALYTINCYRRLLLPIAREGREMILWYTIILISSDPDVTDWNVSKILRHSEFGMSI